MVIGNIVGSFFQGLPGVAHGDGEEGFFEHGDVVETVPEYDRIFRLSADAVQHAQDAAALIGRFDEVRMVDIFQVWQIIGTGLIVFFSPAGRT